ncbi:hypothetical protein B0T25DRAFT_571579 [Lasiosphaeria hispida]|uniref:Uncharacterized protein n=1 Tax=Lasiosphaeria hispida TaxID=260671 RepID=A0AAJ0MAM7_9PEZI|nr:hypothetical protein B0T25DRAFT_571579 [Lasiosphaeria hispida]
MALFETNEVLKVNDKTHTVVLISPNQVDNDDVDLFVVQSPPALHDPAHRAPSEGEGAAEKLPAACLVHAGAKTLQEGDKARCHLLLATQKKGHPFQHQKGHPFQHLCVLLMANLRVKRLAMRSIDQSNIEMCWQSRQPKLTRLHFALTHRGHPRSSRNYWNILKFHLQGSSEFDMALLGFTGTP